MTILGCGAEMAKLMAVSDEDVQTIEDVLKERLDMGIARPEAQRQAVAEAIAMLGAERAVVMGAITAKVAELPQAAKPATHQDPGAAPEAATAPVIAESLQKSAKKENRPLAEMKAELLGMIDAAVKLTPDYQDHMAAIEKVGKEQADAIYTGLNYRNSQKTVEGKGSITFDVPGDGKFRVTNSYAGLMAFRGKIDKASGNGFSATKRPGLPASTSVKKGSTNQISAIESMLEDGDLQAAKDYMAAVGIGTDGLKKSALARIEQLEALGDNAQEALYTRIDPEWQYSVDRGSRRATLTRTIGKDVYRAHVMGGTRNDAPDDFSNATYGISKNGEKDKPGSAGNFHDALVMVQASLDKLADKAGTESQAAPASKAKATPAEAAPISSVQGQKNLANRGSRIATLKMMNEQIRKLDPSEAWHDSNIEDASDLDALQDSISQTLVELQRKTEAKAEPEVSKTGKLPVFPVDAYRLERFYANGAKIKPLPARTFSLQEVQSITDWFKSIGWSVTSGSGGNGINATNDIGMTIDDLPEPYTAAQRKKDEALLASDERAAAKKKEQEGYLASTAAGKFVAGMFGDAMNRYNQVALAKVLSGDEKTFAGLFSNSAADVLSEAGISAEGREIKDVIRDIKAMFDTAPTSTAKEPWQMTEAEFGEVERQKALANVKYDLERAKNGSLKPFVSGDKSKPALVRRLTAEIAQIEAAKPEGYAGDHLAQINKALREGKPVPEVNLKRYDIAAPKAKLDAMAAPAIPEQKTPANTGNAGDELSYNRRNRIKTGVKWDDLAGKDEALRIKETNKQNVSPRPDYAALVAGGMNPLVAHIVKQAYDAIATTPNVGNKTASDAALQGYIEGVNRYMEGVMSWANNPAQTNQWLRKIGASASASLGAMRGTPTSLSALTETSDKSLYETVYPGGWRAFESEVRLIGGNKVLAAVQPSMTDAQKAMKDIGKGWPEKQEAWQKQGFRVVSGDGLTADFYSGKHMDGKSQYTTAWVLNKTDRKSVTIEQQSFDGAPEVSRPLAQAWADQRIAELAGKHILMDKSNRNAGAFDTLDAAQEKARELTRKESKSGKIKEAGISVEAAERQGVAHRMEGEDITSDRLKETFGLRGVNFGTWMLGDSPSLVAERQLHLNHAYDSLMDLAAIMDVPPKAMSLDGLLGLAIGAQGNGGAAAHFVPGVNEINLTRTSGAGSLAHEWGHALDHYFARQAELTRQDRPFLTSHVDSVKEDGYVLRAGQKVKAFGDVIRPEIVAAFRSIVKAMTERKMTQEEHDANRKASEERSRKNIDGWLANFRRQYDRVAKQPGAPADSMEKFDAIAERIKALDLGEGKVSAGNDFAMSPVVSDLRDHYKAMTGRLYSLDEIKGLQSNIDALKYKVDALAAGNTHVPNRDVPTRFAEAAAKLDKEKGGKLYWSTKLEMFARAFDAFVSDKLDAIAAKNTYLSHAGRTGDTVPNGPERTAINASIQTLIDTIETKDTDKGVAMFSRSTPFYSELSRQIEAANINAAPGFGWKATLKGLMAKGVKADEITWSGIEEWLDLQTGKVTKAAVLEYLAGKGALEQPGFTITPAMQEKASGGLPLFAKNTTQFSPAAQAQSIEAVEATVDALRRGMLNAPEVVVAFDMQDARIPRRVHQEDLKQRSGGARGAPEGFYYRGTVYMMASQLKTIADVARVFNHETAHYGLHGKFGGVLKPILQQIVTMRRAQVDAKVKEYGLRGVSNLDLLTAAEEVLAEMAQTTPEIGFVKRAIAAIRTWLRTHVPGFKNLALTDAEIIRSYILPARGWVERGGNNGGPRAGLAFARSKPTDQTNTPAFKAWFGDSKVVDADGKPLVVYHGTDNDFTRFNSEATGGGGLHSRLGFFFAGSKSGGRSYAARTAQKSGGKAKTMALYLSLQNPKRMTLNELYEHGRNGTSEGLRAELESQGYDGIIAESEFNKSNSEYVAFRPEQVKSATGNRGTFDPADPDIRFSRAAMARDLTQKATEAVRVFTNTPGKVNWWHKTVGTQYNLAQRSPEFKRVYDAVQDFIGDVSFYATEAADLAPKILPKLDTWRDIAKSPLSADDTKAIAAPIFEGTLVWARNEAGQPVKVAQLEEEAALMSSDRKAQRLLRNDKISEGVLKMWRGLPLDQYEALIDSKYAKEMLKAGLVWSDAELRSQFALSDDQIALYREFRAATDKSLTNLAISDMLYFGGKDVAPIKEAVLEAKTVDEAAEMLRSYLMSLASDELSTGVDMAAVGEAKALNDQADTLEAGAGGRSSKAVRALEAEISAKSDLAVSRGKAGDMPGADKIMAEVAKLEKKLESAQRAANGYEFIKAKELRAKAKEITDTVFASAPEPSKRHASLIATANKMLDKGNRAADLMARGYAPLSRFGTYTLDVVDASGERVYFGLFESRFEADRMAKQMAAEYPGGRVEQGTLSEESYKLFAGVSPETVALFGDMLGLEDNGAYQDYLKLAKSTRSAMKRLIERKGIAGFSEDAGQVLAGFVYSNARQTSQNLHTGEMVQAANDIPKGMGELKDKATQLVEYIKHPQEEAQKVRGLLFAQYIGGSVASAMVNMTQPFTMTMPWLSQFGGLAKSAKQMTAAVKDATKKTTGDAALDAAIKRGEEDGTVSPQEVHDLMRQAQGKGALKSGDGTKLGNATATAQNAVSRIGFAWGKLFSTAEQFNRRVTFIAAYRTAVEQGMSNPDAFARRAIHETQGVYNKGNKPDWARGAVGSTLFTFKQYSIAYVEMLHRMATTGEPGSPERAAGRRGALYALAVLMLLSGVGGLPGADDLDDIISGLMQSLGYNFDSKAKRKAFLAEYLGDGAAQFMERGVSGIAGVPIDISGRMGLGNLIPATGLLTKKTDHTSDVAELLGPAGDLAKRAFQAGGKLIEGDVLGSHGAVATASPKAVQNLFQAADMATTGMYRDQTGKKVMETGPGDALSKALGFQPNDVKRQQDATWEVKRMVDLNRITETEIADRWAIGLFEKDMEKVQGARDDLAKWNADNPESPIRIKFPQILQRVRAMNQTKAERIAKTAPKELKAQVREVLSQQ